MANISLEKAKTSLIKRTQNTNKGSNKGPFDFLKDINDWLESVPLRIINAFQNLVGDWEHAVQEKVDKSCAWLAWKVNVAVEGVRQRLIKALYNMYKNTVVGKVMQVIGCIKRLLQNPLQAIVDFASAIFAPFGLIMSWFSTLATEIPRLAKNLANIMDALPPSPPNPNINFNAFKLKIKTISISDVTSSPDNLPAPEVMFPEPEKPFTKDTFKDVFTGVSAKLKSSKLIYKLSDKNKQILSDSSMDNTSLVAQAIDDNVNS